MATVQNQIRAIAVLCGVRMHFNAMAKGLSVAKASPDFSGGTEDDFFVVKGSQRVDYGAVTAGAVENRDGDPDGTLLYYSPGAWRRLKQRMYDDFDEIGGGALNRYDEGRVYENPDAFFNAPVDPDSVWSAIQDLNR